MALQFGGVRPLGVQPILRAGAWFALLSALCTSWPWRWAMRRWARTAVVLLAHQRHLQRSHTGVSVGTYSHHEAGAPSWNWSTGRGQIS